MLSGLRGVLTAVAQVVMVDESRMQLSVLVVAEHYVVRADVAVDEVPSVGGVHVQQYAGKVEAHVHRVQGVHRPVR